MDGVVEAHVRVDAWVPLCTSLSQEDVVSEDFSVVAPLFDTQTTAG